MLIVGLGNPGLEYVGSRHNVGWEAIDRLAARMGLVQKPSDFDRYAKTKFSGLIIEDTVQTKTGPRKICLLKPTTYMNLSGHSVQPALAYYRWEPMASMTVLDDLALPAGKIRLRSGGSHGGHNGLRDIQRALGTMDYPRLRIGIDPVPPTFDQKDYVLGKFSPEQRVKIDVSLDRAVQAIECWMNEGMAKAMNQFNAEVK